MHHLQEKLLRLAAVRNLGSMSYREIGKLIEESSAQKVKHHLIQLEKNGLITIDRERGTIERAKRGVIPTSQLAVVPILGAANCGPAEITADANIEGYVRISKGLLHGAKHAFAVRARGDSMNAANVDGKAIEDGDLVIVDSDDRAPSSGSYVLSIIDGAANIKKLYKDERNRQITLKAESTHDFPPIYIREEDASEYLVNGRVIQVIKKHGEEQ